MHFGLDEQQKLLQQTVRAFVDGECPPARRRELFDAGEGHDPALWKGLAEIGIPGLAVPEELGGAGLELLELALVMEELGAGALPAPLLGHVLAGLAIQLGGSAEQQKRWLPGLASGECVATIALAEAGDRWEPEDWQLALRDGSLSGAKRHVPIAGAVGLVVVGTEGGGFAVVEGGADGLRVESVEGIDRTRPIAALHFDGVAAEALADGAKAAARVRDAALVLLAADALGAAWRLMHETCEYTKAREQFGRPLAGFQSVKHQLADMALEIEPCRGLLWYAAHAWDRMPDEAAHAAAIAKAHIGARACEVAREAVELHGGIGFTWECDVQVWLKRMLFDRAWAGTPEHHRARIAALGGW